MATRFCGGGLGWVTSALEALPNGQVLRYLVVGGWNTLFGYGCYALLTYLLTGTVPCAYMVAGILSTAVNITVSYLSYKTFVFKTKGNFVREYLRCYVVYGTTILLNLALLPVLVVTLDLLIRPQVYVPYIAGAILIGSNVGFSFLGHRRYTFSAP